MANNEPPRFIFHGNAMPFGGRITKKNDAPSLGIIQGPPAAALAVTGGLSRATGGPANPHEAFRWGGTLAEAKGELLSNGRYVTTVTSSISQVWAKNDPHVFEADTLRVIIVSEHAPVKPASIQIKETVFGGTQGIRLDGDRIDVEVHTDLNDAPTLDAFEDKFQTNREFFDRHQVQRGSFRDPVPRTSGGYVITSIVRRLKWRNKVIEGNTLRLSGFGALYFGEVLMNENRRRLTMVRLRMGSALGAEVAYAEADPNGNWGN
jgi:hypothetical protein